MMKLDSKDFSEIELMKQFNNKDNHAFVEVYNALYKQLYYYTSNLYKNTTIDANDIIHDMFIIIWDTKKYKFENFAAIKTYFYVAIKNKFINYISHLQCEDKYKNKLLQDDFNIVSEVAEIETLSIINEALHLLPEECAKVFQLHLNGWDVKSIAQKLDKAQSTVYAQKNEAISILKQKISKDKLFILMSLIH